ncbi:hypothetical protein [Clostridium cadaveris]|uniref:hypothetical protein n=1 Tax=Clostridium cadaveris TaxID=1529 RepID=UPI003993E66A
MTFANKVIECITENYNILEWKETFESVTLNLKCTLLVVPDLQKILKLVSHRDRIRFKIIEDGYTIASYSTGDSIDDFVKEINLSEYRVELTIVKNIEDNELSIYDFDKFSEFLESLSLKNILTKFNYILSNNYIIFRIKNDNYTCESKSIFILPEGKEFSSKVEDRNIVLKKRTIICNFLNASEYKLIASDFRFNKNVNSKFNKIMHKLSEIISVISISDISIIKNENEVSLTINGYRRVDSIIKYDTDIDEDKNIYYDVQEWLYSDGNLNDKIGIIRNLISINVEKNNIFSCNSSLFSSIKSAHEIYLKQNIEKYLNVKEKVTEFLIQLNEETSKIANTLGDMLFSNAKVGITFYGTVVIMNILSDKRLDNIFTDDIIYISFIMIILSFIFMMFSRYQIKKDIERFNNQYFRVKHSYDEILDEEDIEEIFKHDLYLKEDLEYINKKVNAATKCWMIILLVLLSIFIIA